MVSSNKADFDLRESSPLSRNTLHNCGVEDHGTTGQRTDWKLLRATTSLRSWLSASASTKAAMSNLTYLIDVRDSVKNGSGHIDNRHLHYFAKSISVNVGGSQQNAKASSLPMTTESVGAVIVVRGWESQPHGEGPQFVGTPMQKVTECQHEGGSSCECR